LHGELGFVGGPGAHDVLGEALVLALVLLSDVADHEIALAVNAKPGTK
jgi:hypothetical protein